MKRYLFGAIALLATGSALASVTCHYIQITDSCANRLWVYAKASNSSSVTYWRSISLGGYVLPSGVALSTVPGSLHSFVTDGEALHVVLFTKDKNPVVYTRYPDELTGISGLKLQKVAAARPVKTDEGGTQDPQYALYVVGHAPYAGGWQPYLIVLDQEALIAGASSAAQLVLGTTPLCDPPGCKGKSLDIAVSGPQVAEEEFSPDASTQFAYASVIFDEGSGVERQAFARITRTNAAHGPWSVTVDPQDVDPATWEGSVTRVGGVAFENDGNDAYGVFQSSGAYTRLGGGPSCAIAGPLDVAMLGPVNSLAGTIGFVSSAEVGSSEGKLTAIAGDCPGQTGFTGDEVVVFDKPIAVGFGGQNPDSQVSVYTINRALHKLGRVEATITDPGGATAVTFGSVDTTTISDPQVQGCPTDLAVGPDLSCLAMPHPTGIEPQCIGSRDPSCPPPPPPPPPPSGG